MTRKEREMILFAKLQLDELNYGGGSINEWAELEEMIMEDLNYHPEVPDLYGK
jgi:hypothetical protein